MLEKTKGYQLPLLYTQQARKEYTINEALTKLDAVVNRAVYDIVQEIPEELDDNLYILAAEPKQNFAANANNLVFAYNFCWEYLAPFSGQIFYIIKKGQFALFDGQNWQLLKR